MIPDIKRRLNIGFAFAIFLVLLVGVISFITFEKEEDQSELVKHTYKVINQLGTIQNILIDMETGRRGFRSTNDTKFLQPYYTGVRQINPAFEKLLELIKDNAEQTNNARAIKVKVDDVLTFWDKLGLDASKYTRSIIQEINTAEKVKMDIVRGDILRMISIEDALLVKRENANSSGVKLAKGGLIIGILLILLIVIALILQILREFKNRQRAEVSLRKNFKELASVNQENAERNWLLAGVAKVNDNLQGELSTFDLSQSILNAIVKYLKLSAAAFYIYNNNEKKLDLAASYAIGLNAKRSYDLSEGFVGQAGIEKAPIVIKNVPSNYITIEAATLNASPAHACYAGLFLNNQLEGVLELLSFDAFNENHLEFLKIVSKNISVALHSAQSREKVNELLEQVQHQKEELEHQQEELRQTNEELTLQAEVLQSSEEELRVQEEELRQINVELEEKNEAMENARHALAIKARELEAASKYKSEFLANMSHELRTPLNSVLILAKLLADNATSNLTEKQVAHAKIIYKSGSDLLNLINDILDLSKIEAGKADLFIDNVSVKSIAADLEGLFTIIAEEKDIDYNVSVDPASPQVIKTDKQKLEQILKNLLSNAFKFTEAKGKVTLTFKPLSKDGVDYLSMVVSDTGIGISEENQSVIFEAFQQADGATNRKFGGTGLGLSITRELSRLLNGKVSLESKAGEGSTFTVVIPVDAAITNTENTDKQTGGLKHSKDLTQQTSITDDRYNIKKGDKVMLIIEDDELFAMVLKGFAGEKGYKTIVALKGDEGLWCAKEFNPSAIILDMNLPVIDGSSLLQIFKNDPALKNIPVHVISAAADVKFSALGALAILEKPIDKEAIDKAFNLIEDYRKSAVRRILLLSDSRLEDEIIPLLKKEGNYDVNVDVVATANDALEKLRVGKFDCMIADIQNDIEKGITDVRFLYDQLLPQKIPTIIYLDADITPAHEMMLKKIADVVVRKSSLSTNRLMDELELFLYKVQEEAEDANSKNYSLLKTNGPTNSDNNLEKKKVLIVDDDMRNVFALSAALEHEHMDILTACDGKEALDILEKNKGIDIVLMDIMMPEMDGYEAMQVIRKQMMLTKLPVIALTAKAMAGDKEKCIEAGASDYITKPIDTHKLISLMRVWLS